MALGGAALIWQGVPGWPGPVLLGGGLLALATSFARDRVWRRFYRGALKYTAPITATFDASGVGVQSAEGENHVGWAHFRHFAVTPDFLLLIVDQRDFSIIPRAAYPDPTTGAAIEDLVSRHLKRLPRRYL